MSGTVKTVPYCVVWGWQGLRVGARNDDGGHAGERDGEAEEGGVKG